VAVGGGLDPELVLDAYRHGTFPWYEADGPVLWWCPDPRAVLLPEELHVSRRLERTLGRRDLEIRHDTAFEQAVRACARGRPDGTWIHPEMVRCYADLHRRGHAHSVEVWREGRLVGGVYGVTVGGVFAAESMFHLERDASKVALVALVRHAAACGFELIDVQFLTPHLARLGCREVPRAWYLARLGELARRPVDFAGPTGSAPGEP
jgi:leucyl/phenylalanyl-tRNA--protein transferase